MALNIANKSSGGGGGRTSSRGGSFGSGKKASSGSLKAPAPARKAVVNNSVKSSPQSWSSTPNYNNSYSSSPSGGYAAPAPAAPAIPTEANYLAGDATYQATLAALKKQLQNFTTDINTQRSNRKLDYDKSLKDLGYVAPDPNARGAGPSWNWEDTLTASGRANQNQLNDFAARGMLQSSGYADSFQDLTRSLMDQYTGIDQSNTQFNTDLDRQLTRAKDENTSASQAARAQAIMRRAAQYGFGV